MDDKVLKRFGILVQRKLRSLQGIVLLEIMFATCFFSVATLALIASTVGVFQMHGKQDEMTKIVNGAHSIVEQILASDFNDPAFQNGAQILGTEVPATANIPDLTFKVERTEIDSCTHAITVEAFVGDVSSAKYSTKILKVCPEFLPDKAYALGAGNNQVYESLYNEGNKATVGIRSSITTLLENAPPAKVIIPPPGEIIPPPGEIIPPPGEIIPPTYEGNGRQPNSGDFGQGCGGTTCFIGGTLISMADGTQKPIENVTVGETVFSYDFQTGTKVQARVIQTFVHESNVLGYLKINNLKLTDNHPLWIGGKWVEAGQAKIGDKIFLEDGTEETVFSIDAVPGSTTVYNLEVDGTHNYYANRALVHNKMKPEYC